MILKVNIVGTGFYLNILIPISSYIIEEIFEAVVGDLEC